MSQDVGHGLDRFDRPARRSRNIEHETMANRPGHTSREASERAGAAHRLGQARSIPLDDSACRLRREIGGRETSPSGCDDEPNKRRRKLDQRCGHRPNAIGNNSLLDNTESIPGEHVGQRGTGPVLAGAPADRFGDREYFRHQRHINHASCDGIAAPSGDRPGRRSA